MIAVVFVVCLVLIVIPAISTDAQRQGRDEPQHESDAKQLVVLMHLGRYALLKRPNWRQKVKMVLRHVCA